MYQYETATPTMAVPSPFTPCTPTPVLSPLPSRGAVRSVTHAATTVDLQQRPVCPPPCPCTRRPPPTYRPAAPCPSSSLRTHLPVPTGRGRPHPDVDPRDQPGGGPQPGALLQGMGLPRRLRNRRCARAATRVGARPHDPPGAGGDVTRHGMSYSWVLLVCPATERRSRALLLAHKGGGAEGQATQW